MLQTLALAALPDWRAPGSAAGPTDAPPPAGARRPSGLELIELPATSFPLGAGHGGFAYDSDSYADDLPYWTAVDGTDHLVVPYTLDTNDMRFAIAGGFGSGDAFFTHLRDAFDVRTER